MTIEPVPTCHMLPVAGPGERGRKFGRNLSRVPVPQLMESAAVIVEHLVVLMDQPEQLILSTVAHAQCSQRLRILTQHPRCAIRVAIESYGFGVRDHGGQYNHFYWQHAPAGPAREFGFPSIRFWFCA